MGLFGNYTMQALPNLLALSKARSKVIDQGLASINHQRSDPVIPRPISGGSNQILNILV